MKPPIQTKSLSASAMICSAALSLGTIIAQAQVGSGWTQYSPSKLYNSGMSQSQRYSISGNVEHFWTYTTDTDEFPGRDSGPRSEWRVQNDYSTGSQQFQGDLNPENGTSSYTCFQIFGAVNTATSIQLQMRSSNGTLRHYNDTVLATGCWGIYTRVNVLHYPVSGGTGSIEVWINGSKAGTFNDGGDVNHYFKYGVYDTASATSYVGDYWRGASYFKGGNSSVCPPTPITPYLEVNGGSWQQTDTVTINSGDSVTFGPQPTSGGSWSWSGPNGFGSTSRQITVSSITSSGNYVATYVNDCGSASSDTFVVTVNGSSGGGSIDTTAVYMLQNEASGLVLNNQGSVTNGSKITQWSSASSDNLRWHFDNSRTTSGYYEIISQKSGLDAVVQSASTSQGAGIIQWSFGSSGDDQWQPVQNSDGSYTFFNLNSGLVLEDPASSTSTSTQMDQWGSNSGLNQEWQLIKQ